ncbi:Sec-independent protein translocase protein TatCy [Crateriforma conspicua]|uniref:Sec-independent protein translocase protein TatC n=2 Tax=Planctomycetaceae TaxID=126 RepID=A0A5C6FRZ4_9PLAN|nr:Sec-independent protein translocase protein TatCy [Crateriforma conspicua]
MDRISTPNDDLFENSTMTFGEHLRELQQALTKACIWLGIGVAIGLFFANQVVAYIKTPLEQAIHQYHAERGMALLGVEDTKADELKPLRDAFAAGAWVVEEVVPVPGDLQDALSQLRSEDTTDADSETSNDAVPDPEAGEAAISPDAIERLAELADQSPQFQLRKSQTNVSSFEMTEGFMIWFKAALVIGAVVSSPFVFYHLWTFVAAGLHAHERRYVYLYLPVSVGLFVSGVLMAFYVVLQYVIHFLLQFNESMDVAFEPRLNYYVSFVLLLPLGFGIAFQLPLVMLFLQRIGLLETEAYTSSWRVAVVVIFVISMLVTPADWTSMVLLAIPLLFLYLLGIGMCMFLPRGRGLGSDAYDPVS